MKDYIAISWSDYEKYGCPNCGNINCVQTGNFRGGSSQQAKCKECNTNFIVLADGLMKSTLGFGMKDNTFFYPEWRTHPRKGMPTHAFVYVRPDKYPEGEGEYFAPRGIGYDLAGFVESKLAGERIVKMFEVALRKPITTWLDYREYEPDWIQVKVQKEDVNLDKLYKLTKEDGIITIDKIRKSI